MFHILGWPSFGIHFVNGCNSSNYLNTLLTAASKNPEKFEVHTPRSMPDRYHFSNNYRIAPIYVIPKIGYVLTTREEGDVGVQKGVSTSLIKSVDKLIFSCLQSHGYDNNEPAMHAVFVAHGPFSTNVKDVHSERSVASSVARLSKQGSPSPGWHSIEDSVYVMEGFENVQIYGLVMKLLGLENWAARNNGTQGFWDKYF